MENVAGRGRRNGSRETSLTLVGSAAEGAFRAKQSLCVAGEKEGDPARRPGSGT